MPHINVGDATLYYERSGISGAPVLILSTSLGASMQMWEPQQAALEPHFDLVRYDMRGHGASSVPPGPYSVELLGRDLLALIESLHVTEAAFCGISLGGAIGQWLAIHAPENFRAFIFANTAAKIGTLDNWTQRIAAVQQGGLESVADRILPGWLTASFREENPQIVQQLRGMLTQCDPAGYVAACAAVRDFDLRDAIAGIRKPVCILAGQHDPSTTLEDARFLHRSIHGSKLIELPAAHLSNIEASAGFSAAVLDFLAVT